MKKILVFFLIFLPVLMVVTILAYHLAYFDRIYPGIKIAGTNVGNLQKEETRKLVAQKFALLPPKILLLADSKTWELDFAILEVSYKTEATVEKAYQIGRDPLSWQAWQEKYQAWTRGLNLPLEFSFNEILLDKKIEEIQGSVFVPVIDPQIKILPGKTANGGSKVVIEPAKEGRQVNQEALKREIRKRLSYLDLKPIVIEVETLLPFFSLKETEEILARAEKFLGKTLELQFEETIFSLGDQELINFLNPEGFNQKKIKDYARQLASSVNRPSQNAAFQFLGGRVVTFKPAKEGIRLKQEEIISQIQESLRTLEEQNQKKISFNLPVERIKPSIQTENVNSLGIKELLGKGQSFFRGSPASRVHNIILASSRLNGVLIAPQEIFSFNQALGEVSKSTGFQEAYIIKEGRTILDDGGGVCQVSTNFFRAALASGLPIEERQPHAYRVSYYEQGFGPGLDATVFNPSPDLKFKNDTPAYILIQTIVETKTSTLTVEFYGSSDGRKATIGPSRVWDRTPPPPPLYQEDPTLPVGQVKQTEKAIWGAKVAFDWKVERGGKILQERTFYSNYQPWQAVYLRGPSATQ